MLNINNILLSQSKSSSRSQKHITLIYFDICHYYIHSKLNMLAIPSSISLNIGGYNMFVPGMHPRNSHWMEQLFPSQGLQLIKSNFEEGPQASKPSHGPSQPPETFSCGGSCPSGEGKNWFP